MSHKLTFPKVSGVPMDTIFDCWVLAKDISSDPRKIHEYTLGLAGIEQDDNEHVKWFIENLFPSMELSGQWRLRR